MTKQEHIEIHIRLHNSLCELLNDYHQVTKQKLDLLSLKELFGWSLLQTTDPASSTQIEDSLKLLENNGEAPPDGNDNENILNSQILTDSPTPVVEQTVEPKLKRKRKTRA